MKKRTLLAFDIGASGGRALVGMLECGRLVLKEIRRFPNVMISKEGRLCWDADKIFTEIKKGIQTASLESLTLDSMGVDTWGVDFGLLDKTGRLIGSPLAYRDERNQGAMQNFFSLMPRRKVYELTGIQFLQFNTLFQLYALKLHDPHRLDRTSSLLFMPDIFNFWLTGKKSTEFTFATTSQLFNPSKMDWEEKFFEILDVSPGIMNKVEFAGGILGGIKTDLASVLGIKASFPVVLVAAHDTASAVSAVPAHEKNWAFISSGTWSIMGIERDRPLINTSSLEKNFTNEGAWTGTFRFCKNISGLWPLQECRRIWSKKKRISYDTLIQKAEGASPFRSLINPDDPMFLMPQNMPRTIRSFCKSTDQPAPESQGQIVRCLLESLALKYRHVLDELRCVSEKPVERLHVIGGGVNNKMLCQFTAEATGLPVYAGPVEATAIGNMMIQAFALGAVEGADDVRAVIERSFNPEVFLPQHPELWEREFKRYCGLLEFNERKDFNDKQ